MSHGREVGKMSIALNSWLDYFAVRGNKFVVQGGRSHMVKIYPTVHLAAESFRKIDMEKRGCRLVLFEYRALGYCMMLKRTGVGPIGMEFGLGASQIGTDITKTSDLVRYYVSLKHRFRNEVPTDHSTFRYYTKKACIFECSLEKVLGSVGCVPWDYPLPHGIKSDTFPTCTSYKDSKTNNSRYAFELAMDDSDTIKACTDSCLPDCEETTYEVHVDTTALEPEELCAEEETRQARNGNYCNSINS